MAFRFKHIPCDIETRMQEVTGDPSLMYVWLPDCPRRKNFSMGDGDPGGCMGIIKWVDTFTTTYDDGAPVHYSAPQPFLIWKFDGMGMKLRLDMEFILEGLVKTDRARLGGAARARQSDNLRQKAQDAEHRTERELASNLGRNELLFNAMAAEADRMGVVADKEEILAMERKAAIGAERLAAQRSAIAKDLRMLNQRRDEELF